MKWMYRKHPELGTLQQTPVTTAEAETELLADGWTANATEHGVAVQPAAQIHATHAAASNQLFESVTVGNEPAVAAEIHEVLAGDISQ